VTSLAIERYQLGVRDVLCETSSVGFRRRDHIRFANHDENRDVDRAQTFFEKANSHCRRQCEDAFDALIAVRLAGAFDRHATRFAFSGESDQLVDRCLKKRRRRGRLRPQQFEIESRAAQPDSCRATE
jgi:hypothetical protein